MTITRQLHVSAPTGNQQVVFKRTYIVGHSVLLKTTCRWPVKAETCSCLVQSLKNLNEIVVFGYKPFSSSHFHIYVQTCV